MTHNRKATRTAVSPLSLCRHLDIHTVYPAVCSEARLAAGTKVLIARGGEVSRHAVRVGWRADSQRKIPLPGGPQKDKRGQSRSKAKQKQKKHSQERPWERRVGVSRKERRPRAGSGGGWGLFAAVWWHSRCVVTKRDAQTYHRRFPSLSLQTPRYTYCISCSLL